MIRSQGTPAEHLRRLVAVVGCWLSMALLVGVTGYLPAAWGQQELFVSNAGNNSVTVYASTAGGNVVPTRILIGPATGLNAPRDLAVDTVNNELFVANNGNNSVTVYVRTASGNTAPLRTISISGGSTGLNGPVGVFVDTVNNELFVTNFADDSVSVYARTASDPTAPLRTLSGLATGLNGPVGVVVDTVNNELFVVNFVAESVTVYARTQSGNTAPIRAISILGGSTGLDDPDGLFVDTVNNELFVTNFDGAANDSVTVYARTASDPTAPTRTLSGAATGLNDPIGVAVDIVGNELFVANLGNSSVTVYARTQSGNTAPLRTIAGLATGLNSPEFIALAQVAAIPTLSEWAQIGMAGLLVLGGLLALRRRPVV